MTRPIGSNGMNVSEQTVMERWDAGQSKQRIVRETGLPRGRVEEIVAVYHFAGAELRYERKVRAASQALAAACIATGSSFR